MESALAGALGYCRNSTIIQRQAGTIKHQQKEIEKCCLENEFKLFEIFTDEGISGTTAISQRPAFLKLINFIEAEKKVKYLVIFSLDRLARDLMIQEQIINLINKSGIKIVSIREPDLFGDDPTRKFIRQILGAASEFEKSIITTRMIAGRINKALSGKYSGGRIPYGYVKSTEDKKNKNKPDLVMSEIQSENVKVIFEMKARKMSYRSIARYLNNSKVEPPRGKRWYPATIRYLFLNPVYRGELNYKGISNIRTDLAIV